MVFGFLNIVIIIIIIIIIIHSNLYYILNFHTLGAEIWDKMMFINKTSGLAYIVTTWLKFNFKLLTICKKHYLIW